MAKEKTGSNGAYRVTLDFSRQSKGYIDDLQGRANCSTRADVFRQALNVFDYVVNALESGGKFLIVDDKGEQKEVVFPIMVSRIQPPDKPK